MIARLTVQRGTLTEYPLAQKVRGGWQNGVSFYADETVVKVTPLTVMAHDDQCEAEYVVGASAYTECGCSSRRMEVRADD